MCNGKIQVNVVLHKPAAGGAMAMVGRNAAVLPPGTAVLWQPRAIHARATTRSAGRKWNVKVAKKCHKAMSQNMYGGATHSRYVMERWNERAREWKVEAVLPGLEAFQML